MKKFLLILFTLSLLVAGTTVFATPKNHKVYDCKKVGVQKVKPYHFKKIRHFGYFAISLKVKGNYKITKQ